MLRTLKTYEAYRHSEMLNKDMPMAKYKAYSQDSAYQWFKNKFESSYGDTRPFLVRVIK